MWNVYWARVHLVVVCGIQFPDQDQGFLAPALGAPSHSHWTESPWKCSRNSQERKKKETVEWETETEKGRFVLPPITTLNVNDLNTRDWQNGSAIMTQSICFLYETWFSCNCTGKLKVNNRHRAGHCRWDVNAGVWC